MKRVVFLLCLTRIYQPDCQCFQLRSDLNELLFVLFFQRLDLLLRFQQRRNPRFLLGQRVQLRLIRFIYFDRAVLGICFWVCFHIRFCFDFRFDRSFGFHGEIDLLQEHLHQ